MCVSERAETTRLCPQAEQYAVPASTTPPFDALRRDLHDLHGPLVDFSQFAGKAILTDTALHTLRIANTPLSHHQKPPPSPPIIETFVGDFLTFPTLGRSLLI